MRPTGYRIADEPKPSGLAHLAVNPFWPFLGVMFGGVWLSWPWFVLNGFAIGSPTRRKEIAIAAGGLALCAVLLLGVAALTARGYIPQTRIPYVILLLTAVKLGVTYWLHIVQSSTFEVYEYYGGIARQGILPVLAGFYLTEAAGAKLLAAAPFLFVLLR
jgi:hypothetical protein